MELSSSATDRKLRRRSITLPIDDREQEAFDRFSKNTNAKSLPFDGQEVKDSVKSVQRIARSFIESSKYSSLEPFERRKKPKRCHSFSSFRGGRRERNVSPKSTSNSSPTTSVSSVSIMEYENENDEDIADIAYGGVELNVKSSSVPQPTDSPPPPQRFSPPVPSPRSSRRYLPPSTSPLIRAKFQVHPSSDPRPVFGSQPPLRRTSSSPELEYDYCSLVAELPVVNENGSELIIGTEKVYHDRRATLSEFRPTEGTSSRRSSTSS